MFSWYTGDFFYDKSMLCKPLSQTTGTNFYAFKVKLKCNLISQLKREKDIGRASSQYKRK